MQDRRAIRGRLQRSIHAFQAAHGIVRVHEHDETVAEPACRSKHLHVPRMQQVEASTGRDDDATSGANPRDDLGSSASRRQRLLGWDRAPGTY